MNVKSLGNSAAKALRATPPPPPATGSSGLSRSPIGTVAGPEGITKRDCHGTAVSIPPGFVLTHSTPGGEGWKNPKDPNTSVLVSNTRDKPSVVLNRQVSANHTVTTKWRAFQGG